ncbi:MAG: phosphatidate cytidylyltransferase [Parvibaculales bacterium]
MSSTDKPVLIRLWQALKLRILTALALLPIVIAALYFGGIAFAAFILVAGFLLAYEWVGIVDAAKQKPATLWLFLSLVPVLYLANQGALDQAVLVLLGLFIVHFVISLLARAQLLLWVGGFAYLAPALSSIVLIRNHVDGGLVLVFYLFLMVWLTDIFAMFVGKTIGGPRLAPVISPNKTWSGLLGGMLGAMGGALIFAQIVDVSASLSLLLISAFFAGVAQVGDLVESWVKRRFQVKDSGSLLPGHGGLLDRVDGVISVFLIAYIIIYFRASAEGAFSAKAIWVW